MVKEEKILQVIIKYSKALNYTASRSTDLGDTHLGPKTLVESQIGDDGLISPAPEHTAGSDADAPAMRAELAAMLGVDQSRLNINIRETV